MKYHAFILVAIAFLFASCNENVLVDEFHTIPDSGWQYKELLMDSFEVVESGHYHQIAANLKVNGDYAYANIHLKLRLTSPDGTTKDYKLPIALAEKSGKWLGSGLGNAITFRVPILHRKVLNQKGKYKITLAQDMRLESLPNVISAGIRVEQQEEIF